MDMSAAAFSFYYSGLMKDLSGQSPGLRVLASQGETRMGHHENRGLRKLIFGLIGKALLGSLHLSDGKELRTRTTSLPLE